MATELLPPAEVSLPSATAPVPVLFAPDPSETAARPELVAAFPSATEKLPDAVEALEVLPPLIAKAPVLLLVPLPAVYCANATSLTVIPPTRVATAMAFAMTDRFGFPREETFSATATQAPDASLQIDRYTRFMAHKLQTKNSPGKTGARTDPASMRDEDA
jgi:hypothetical protein